jgi:hypothetical protein
LSPVQVNSNDVQEWANVLRESVRVCVAKDALSTTAGDLRRKWTNGLRFNDVPLSAGAPRYRVENDAIIKGKAAVKRVRSLVSGGSDIQFPLYRSGFWVTIEPPSEQDWIDFYASVATAKINLGRSTNGGIFSNLNVLLVSELCELVASKIVNTTAPGEGDLFDHIKQVDLFNIAWSLACVMFPTGFPYSRPVLPNIKSEGETDAQPQFTVVREHIDIRKTMFVDENSFTEDQMLHMTLRNSGAMTTESIAKYQEQFKTNTRSVVIDKLCFKLAIPSLNQQIAYGKDWIYKLTDTLDEVLTVDTTDKERNDRLTDYARASTLRQYGHWVKSIDLLDTNNTIEDQETINDVLTDLSSDKHIRVKFIEEISKYIEDVTVSIVAVPSMNEAEDQLGKTNFPRLIPIDPIQTFFTLLAQKVQSIRQRI